VWVFNYKDPRTGGQIRLSPIDIVENPDDPRITGVYGTITSLDADDFKMIVELDNPATPNSEFRTQWGARVMVSPADAMGFYWEASQGLVEMVSGQTGIVVHWNFNCWNAPWRGLFSGFASGNALPSGTLISDGDDETTDYPFTKPTGHILRERDWLKLFSAPVRSQYLVLDAVPGANYLRVCSASRFNDGDVIMVQDSSFIPGFRTTISRVDAILNRIYLRDVIPTDLPGFPTFDGFLVSRSAQVYRVVTRANKMACLTTDANEDGTPRDGQGFVVVNHAAGTFTFDEDDTGRARVFYAADEALYQLPGDQSAVFALRSVNKAGVKSHWSTPIVVDATP
jgi:hypothetical protein